jgi:hypothetical protein
MTSSLTCFLLSVLVDQGPRPAAIHVSSNILSAFSVAVIQSPALLQAGVGKVIKGAGAPSTAPPPRFTDLFSGWDQGCLGMKKGEVRKLVIPADEGYGAGGFPAWGIPPNGTHRLLSLPPPPPSRPLLLTDRLPRNPRFHFGVPRNQVETGHKPSAATCSSRLFQAVY